ncbi:unnamed protein product [Trichobilharzia regenti]|nr:unnamed protein product [Trichobilharzia regenti]
MSTNDVEGIIRHVDSLMNPQAAANTTVSTQITTTTTVTTATTSDPKTNNTIDRDQVITDNQNDEKSLCLSTIQLESGGHFIHICCSKFVTPFIFYSLCL